MDATRTVTLKCGVCGSTDFLYDDALYNSIDEAEQVKCIVCNKVYNLKELKDVNFTLIDNTVRGFAKEVLVKELKKAGLKVNMK